MASRRDAIIAELLALDPSLASKREELERAIAAIEAARPSAEPSRAFKGALRRKLRAEMRGDKETAPSSIFFPFSLMLQRSLFAGGGVVLGALLVVVAMQAKDGFPSMRQESSDTPAPAIVSLEPNAFGSLAYGSTDLGRSARPQSGGGGGAGGMTLNAADVVALEEDAKMMAPDSMIYPAGEYKVSRYTYEGAITLPTSDVSVYRRVPPTGKPSAGNIGKGFADQMINWGSFGNLQVQNLQLTEGGKNAYNLSVDFNEGSLSIYRNYDVSMRPDMGCTTPECWEANRLRESDMLADEELLQIARSFADEYGLDLSGYGDAQVMNDWRVWYAQSTDKSSYYFPEQMNVVFPLLMDGKAVYEEYGAPFGINISVDVRTKTVSGLYNYYFHNYQQSAYAPLADEAKAREVLKYGSMYFWEDPNATEVFSVLGEPTEVFMRYYQWDQATQTNKDLLVPALAFPVTERNPEATDGRERVLVPLAADVYNNQQVYPMPRPLIEDPAATEEAPVEDADAEPTPEPADAPVEPLMQR